MTPAYTAGRNDAADDMDAAMASDDDGLLRDVAWDACMKPDDDKHRR